MASIEPLSSIMTFQAQGTKVVEPVKPAETTEGQNIEVNAPVVDEKTLSISKAQTDNEGNGNQDDGGKEIDQELMRKAMKELNKKASNVTAEFGIHEGTNRITIKMVDKKTKEVIKELPPEKMLDMIARVWEMSGLVVDEKR